MRRRGRPDRRHDADGEGHAQRDRGHGGRRARDDVRPLVGVLHGEAGHRAGRRRRRRHHRAGRPQRRRGGQGQGRRGRGRHGLHPRPAAARGPGPRGPRGRRPHHLHLRRRRRRRGHGLQRGHRRRPAARHRRHPGGDHHGLRGQVPRRRDPGPALAAEAQRVPERGGRRPRPRGGAVDRRPGPQRQRLLRRDRHHRRRAGPRRPLPRWRRHHRVARHAQQVRHDPPGHQPAPAVQAARRTPRSTSSTTARR